jgi:hypothetical protein
MMKRVVPAIVAVCTVLLATADAREKPVWAIDPAVPGSVLASAGRSLFDFVTAGGVPFPFEAGAQDGGSAGCDGASASSRS